jgi:hypothetical protein
MGEGEGGLGGKGGGRRRRAGGALLWRRGVETRRCPRALNQTRRLVVVKGGTGPRNRAEIGARRTSITQHAAAEMILLPWSCGVRVGVRSAER